MEYEFLSSDEFYDWIFAHKSESPEELSLKYHNVADWIKFAITQIDCRQRTSDKLKDTTSNRYFIFPSKLSAEQSTSDIIAQFHASLISTKSDILDITCGLSIDTFHFAKVANHVTALDLNPYNIHIAKHNANVLGLNNIDFICENCYDYAKSCGKNFDMIYADPARRSSSGKRTYSLSDCSPNILDIIVDLKRITNKIMIKVSPMLDVESILRDLDCVSDIYAIGTKRECKELLVLVDLTYSGVVKYHSITLFNNSDYTEIITHERNYIVDDEYNVKPHDFIYIPYPAVSKIMSPRYICETYHLNTISRNAMIFASSDLNNNFCGHIYHVTEIFPFNKQSIKSIKLKYPKIGITTKNFVMTSEDLRKRLKVSDGDSYQLFATTQNGNNRCMIVTRPYNI